MSTPVIENSEPNFRKGVEISYSALAGECPLLAQPAGAAPHNAPAVQPYSAAPIRSFKNISRLAADWPSVIWLLHE